MLTACAADARQMQTSVNGPQAAVEASDAASFAKWKQDFSARAVSQGISAVTVKTALATVKLNPKVISYDKQQPEKKLTKEEYLANVINQARIDQGRRVLAENRELLYAVKQLTGVEPEFIIALYGLESDYGKKQGNYSVINSLATLAYEGRRREFFEGELMAALLIVDSGKASLEQLKGSWAGAMGGCQFMPSSYLAYGFAENAGDKVDIWNNKGDIFYSIANYLSTVGWGPDEATKTKTLMHWNKSTYFVASVFALAGDIR